MPVANIVNASVGFTTALVEEFLCVFTINSYAVVL